MRHNPFRLLPRFRRGARLHERMQPQTKSERGNIMAQRKQDAAISEQLKQMVYTLQEHRGARRP